MKLIDELQERRTHVLEELNRVEDLRAELADFDRAIAALEPAPEPEPETWETMERAEQGEVKTVLLATGADDVVVDEPVEFISELTGDPAIEPESGLAPEVAWPGTVAVAPPEPSPPTEAELLAWAEQRAQAAAREAYLNPPITSPENAHLADDDGSDDPLYLSMLAAEAAEKQPGGYAPVTNPEADAAARALAYYSPEEQRARAAPWPSLGSLFGNKPKEPA